MSRSLEKLPARTVAVWAVRWRDLVISGGGQEYLSEPERKKAARKQDESDRSCYIAGRVIVRALGGYYLDRDPRSLSMGTTDAGKPVFNGQNAKLSFNLSHSGDWILAAFSWEREIGIDVQDRRRRRPPAINKIAAARLRPEEAAMMENAPEEAFYRLWVCKESLVKAAGRIVHRGIMDFAVLPLPQDSRWGRAVTGAGQDYAYRLWRQDENHMASLAVRRTEEKIPAILFEDAAKLFAMTGGAL